MNTAAKLTEAASTGSLVVWGAAACPPTPWMVTLNRSEPANVGPACAWVIVTSGLVSLIAVTAWRREAARRQGGAALPQLQPASGSLPHSQTTPCQRAHGMSQPPTHPQLHHACGCEGQDVQAKDGRHAV